MHYFKAALIDFLFFGYLVVEEAVNTTLTFQSYYSKHISLQSGLINMHIFKKLFTHQRVWRNISSVII